jgi:hypothetical protein
MNEKVYELMEWLGYIGACIGIVFSGLWFWWLGPWAMWSVNGVVLQFAVLIVPSCLGIGLVFLSNKMVDYSKRKLGKKY